MDSKRPSFFKTAWFLVSPIVVYNLVNNLVLCCGGLMYATAHPELLADPADMEASVAAAEALFNQMLSSYYLEIGCISCMLSILFLWTMYRKDRQREKKSGLRVQYEKVPPVFYGAALLLGAAACLLLNTVLIYSRIAELLLDGYSEVSEILYQSKPAIELLYMGALVPVAEELVFRGLLQKRLGTLASPQTALVTAAITFGFYHGNMLQTVYAFALGLLFGWAMERYRSFLAPVLIHAGANIASVMLTEYGVAEKIFNSEIIMLVTMALSMAAFAGLIYVIVTYVMPRPLQTEETISDETGRM